MTADQITSLSAPVLSVVKPAPALSADADGSGDVSAGDTLTYTITATNSGAREPDRCRGHGWFDHADGWHDAVWSGGSGWYVHAGRDVFGDAGRCGGGLDREHGDSRFRPGRSGDRWRDDAGTDADPGCRQAGTDPDDGAVPPVGVIRSSVIVRSVRFALPVLVAVIV